MYDFPRYRSHKVVRASQITDVSDELPNGSRLICVADTVAPITADEKMISRYVPGPGDYLVQYEDGYLSISPQAAFEGGYTLIDGKEQS